jgi:aspartate 1-decarboxylase
MLITVCRAKLNKGKVTACKRDFSGSIAIDGRVLRELHVVPYERVLVVNRDTGARFETYVVPAAEEGTIELQGGAALLGNIGDTIGFLAFAVMSEEEAAGWRPRVVELGSDGSITQVTQSLLEAAR